MNSINQAIKKAELKIVATLNEQIAGFPYYSEENQWHYSRVNRWEDSFSDWTAGFWAGILWSLYAATGGQQYREQANYYTGLLENRLSYNSHDLGFLFYPSCVRGYALTGDFSLRQWALQAAEGLMNRYCPQIRLLEIRRTGEAEILTAIDTMMNLPLLWWAFQESGDMKYFDTALCHARSTVAHFIRADGSTYHILKWSRSSGKLSWKGTWQGFSDDSCWSRGQSWALSGLLLTKIFSGKDEFDSSIDLLLNYIITCLPDDAVPYWDYDLDKPGDNPRDSSAAAIMIYGLLQFSASCPFDSMAATCKDLGLKILHSLIGKYAVTPNDPSPGFLRHGCFHAPKKFATDACLVFGDYYYLESLLTAKSLVN